MTEQALYAGVWAICIAGAAIFSFVVFFGAPFIPTRKSRVAEALDLLNLQPGQTLLELGSGDGRMLQEAARRGIRCVGYELNPLLVLWSRLRCWRWRNLVTVHCANYWKITFPKADGMYVFLMQPYMTRLHQKILDECLQPLRLVSFAFHITDKQPAKERRGLFLYCYETAGSS